jgi:hypothetical protein
MTLGPRPKLFAAEAFMTRAPVRQTGAVKNASATAVMLHLRARYVSKTAILGCWVSCSGQKSKSRLNSKDLRSLGVLMTPDWQRWSFPWSFDS